MEDEIKNKEDNMRYRYYTGGSFVPEHYENIHKETDNTMLCIDIPAPYSHNSEKEALIDGALAYRFVCVDGEVKIAVYPGEDFEAITDGYGKKDLAIWLKGYPIHFYSYEEFKALGGIIFELPNSMIFKLPENVREDELIAELEKWKQESETITWNAKDYEVKATFNELFPGLKPEDKPVYIDNDSYSICEENESVVRA